MVALQKCTRVDRAFVIKKSFILALGKRTHTKNFDLIGTWGFSFLSTFERWSHSFHLAVGCQSTATAIKHCWNITFYPVPFIRSYYHRVKLDCVWTCGINRNFFHPCFSIQIKINSPRRYTKIKLTKSVARSAHCVITMSKKERKVCAQRTPPSYI